jgi:hypothetical protein
MTALLEEVREATGGVMGKTELGSMVCGAEEAKLFEATCLALALSRLTKDCLFKTT